MDEFSRPELDIYLESNNKSSYNILNDNMSSANDDEFIVWYKFKPLVGSVPSPYLLIKPNKSDEDNES